MFALLTGD